VVRNGKKARFWLDVWLGQCPLHIVFNRIFLINNEQDWSIHDILKDYEINLTFRRSFGTQELEEWQQLILLIRGVQLTEEPDTVTWALEKKGNFTTASLYRELTFPGVVNKEVMSIWRARIPMKIKFFLWSVYSDCLPSAEQLVKRHWLVKNFARCMDRLNQHSI
jgi:hypothetical protein